MKKKWQKRRMKCRGIRGLNEDKKEKNNWKEEGERVVKG